MKTLLNWIIFALAIGISAYILPGITVSGVVPALVLAVVLGVINLFIRPLLVILTLPLSIITLGLFTLIINTLLIMLASALVPGVAISNFLWAFLFGIVLALVHSFLKSLQKD